MTKVTSAVPRRVTRVAKVSVSETNVKKAAARLLNGTLVSTEITWIRTVLGDRATQEELDARVVAVRKMPWSAISVPD